MKWFFRISFTAIILSTVWSVSSYFTRDKNPGTVTSVTFGYSGLLAWSLPSNAKTSDDARASVAMSAGQTTEYLQAVDFGFNIPPGSTIVGISAAVEKSGFVLGGQVGAIDDAIQLLKAGALVGIDQSNPFEWGSADTVVNYGSTSDLWATTWTPAQINATNFGIVVKANWSDDSGTATVDSIQLSVYYTEGFPLEPQIMYKTKVQTRSLQIARHYR